jgi:hypothetical protein
MSMRQGLFEPDVLIGELAGAARRRSAALSSEKRLMLAVLRNAFECYQQYLLAADHTGRETFREAAAWIESTSNDGLFSFEGIAEALDFDPGYLRRQLATWRERRLQASATAAAANEHA